MIVQKCCFCCNLKYGFYTWAILNFLIRVSCASMAHFRKLSVVTLNQVQLSRNMLSGSAFGWFLGTALIVLIALKGIVEKRSMLIYPYIVVLVVEILVFLAVTIHLCMVLTVWYLINFFVVGIINTYTIICLISVYQHVRQMEKNQRQTENLEFKTV
ncbi:hypothetical protein RN001_004089 [Aquatica leii]|uniref:Uncharacterized protein n=1 Tax=Aquatica leii TaxID=1421715 RepID=A0AAN7SRT5_9COLE|nr:hypothetical protein RN001_004089 [Aquatica leii]